MVALAALPSSVEISNALAADLVLHAGLRLVASEVDREVVLDGRGDGEKTDLWTALRKAKDAGLITSTESFATIDDPVASGHTTCGGQNPLGTVEADSLP